MPDLVQATPEELKGFADKTVSLRGEAYAAIMTARNAVDDIAAVWGGDFAKRFGQSWPEWQKDMQAFILEMENTDAEMRRLAAIYEQADQAASAATAGVAPVSTP